MIDLRKLIPEGVKLFVTRRPSDGELRVRDLRNGMKVPLGNGKTDRISKIETLEMLVRTDGKVARAVRVSFENSPPIEAHPDTIVR